MKKPKPATEVIAAYLLFRSAYEARGKGSLREDAYRALVASLTPHVDAVFERMYGADDAAAVRWACERLGVLATQAMLTDAEAAALRSHLEPRAAPGDSGHQGAIGLLWRLHRLHQEILAGVERCEVDPARLPPIQRALHDQAIHAVQDASRSLDTPAGDFMESVTLRAEELLEELPASDLMVAEDKRVVRVGLLEGLRGPDETACCRVCGAKFDNPAQVIECAACSTPHHSDCWEYNGGCAIFGCGCVTGGLPTEPKLPERPVQFDLTRPRSGPAPAAMRVMLQLGRVAWLCLLLPIATVAGCMCLMAALASIEALMRLLFDSRMGHAGLDFIISVMIFVFTLSILGMVWKAYLLYPAHTPDNDDSAPGGRG